MFRVTLYTFLTGVRVQVVRSVQPFSRRDTGRDFAVAIDTLECGLAATQLMTRGAVARAIERLVGTRKSAWRDLCYRTTRKPH
jgi:microcompartment protein CcmK/EutM